MLRASCGRQRHCAIPSAIPKRDIRLLSRAPILGIPYPMGFLLACAADGVVTDGSVARLGKAPAPSLVFDICTDPIGEGPHRCSIVVSILACYAGDPGSIACNGTPQCFERPVVVYGPARCTRGSLSHNFAFPGSHVGHPLPNGYFVGVPRGRGRQ